MANWPRYWIRSLLKAYKYSGSKTKLLPLLKAPKPFNRIVEPYGGSAAFALNNAGPAVIYDINTNVIDLWNFLKTTTPERLQELEDLRSLAVSNHPDNKPDVRELGLSKGEETYLRINSSGVYVGQLNSWVLYKQWKLPVKKTSECLPRIREMDFVYGDAHTLYTEKDGDIVFIDPPYIGTDAGYKQNGKGGIEKNYNPQSTIDMISRLSCPIIFTYGDRAQQVFPNYKWEVLLKKKVPNIRRGGTVERTEHVCYINW